MNTFADRALRLVLTGSHLFLRSVWFLTRPKTFGAHAIALTPECKLILVKLRYARGWRLPGGGRSEDEDPIDAALRELREEIGMSAHGSAEPIRRFDETPDFKRDTASLVIVRDVLYRPRKWSWEVQAIREVEPEQLPENTASVTRRWLEAVRDRL